MNEIETDAECDPRNPETWLACDSRNEPAEDGSRRPYRPFWEPCHQTGYDRNHHSTKMLIYFRYVHIIEDLSQNDQSPQMCGIARS